MFINAMCGKDPDPAPTSTPATPTNPVTEAPTVPTVNFSFPEGIVLEVVQNETGLWAENRLNKIEPTFLSSGHLAMAKFIFKSDKSDPSTAQISYTYNKEGYLVSRTTTVVSETGGVPEQVVKEKFEYQDGRLVKTTSTYNTDRDFKRVPDYSLVSLFEYNTQGRLISYKKVDQNGAEQIREVFGYDGKGQINVYTKFSANEPTSADHTYVDGRAVKIIVKRNNVISYTVDLEYDAEGNMTKSTIKYASGVGYSTTYKYDNKKVPKDLALFFLAYTAPNNSGLVGTFDYLIFKGHPKGPLESGGLTHNLLSAQNSYGDNEAYTYLYNAEGYPIETIYKIYNATQKATKDGKKVYTYFK